VRRIALVLLTLVLVPSMATASWYRCAYDGVSRSACCCPTRADQQKKAPAPDTSVRAAGCCAVTHVTSRVPEGAVSTAASIHIEPAALSVPGLVLMPRFVPTAVALDRPRAQGDPPDTLFARRCSLLL
jgi:hypothetical protein